LKLVYMWYNLKKLHNFPGKGMVMERPFFLPLAAMIAGLVTAFFTEGYAPYFILLPLIVAAVSTLFLKSRITFLISISILLFNSTNLSLKPFLFPDYTSTDIARHISEDPFIIEGTIDSRPEPTETGWRLSVQVENIFKNSVKEKVRGRLLLSVERGEMNFITGDRIRFSSRLKNPRNFGLPGEFDYEKYLALRNIHTTAFTRNSEYLILIGDSDLYPFQRRVDMMAMSLGRFITNNISPTEAKILRALLLGDMGAVPKDIKDSYTKAGVNHILSISGFHVGIIAVFVFQIVLLTTRGSESLLLSFNLRRTPMFLIIPILIFYLFLSGAASATIRSVIMIVVYIFAMAVEREVDPIDSLLLAAVIILSLSPSSLFDISFQLSFLAIWGILALTPILLTPFNSMKRGKHYKLLLFFFTSVTAIAATLIPVAYYFHRATLTGLLSNFIIVPLLGYGAVIIGFSALPFIYVIPPIAKLLLITAAFIIKISNWIIGHLAILPMLLVFNPNQLELCIFYLFLVLVTFIKNMKIKCGFCLSLALFLAVSISLHDLPDKGKLILTFFSVGQGESILVKFPEGKSMLIDGGGNPGEDGWDVGERLLAPALWKMGMDSITYMVMSHPHPDHIRGLKYVAENFRIGEFWEGRSYTENNEYCELLQILKRKNIPIHDLNGSSSPFYIGSIRIEPLAPFAETSMLATDDYHGLNDESLVFRMKCGSFSVLFTGDIGKKTESVLARKPASLRCTLLKIPHHGSRYSSSEEFLKAASPRYAVVSVGYKNGYNLPSEEVLSRLKAMGIMLYRTDFDGTTQVVFDNMKDNSVSVRKMGHFR